MRPRTDAGMANKRPVNSEKLNEEHVDSIASTCNAEINESILFRFVQFFSLG
jgi:hypothetical protein